MKETANRYTIALLSVIAVLVLVAFSAPASATCPCVTIDNDTINGSIYYKTYDAWPGTGGSGNYIASHTFTGVPAGVKTARVHTGVWMLDPGNVNITVNGNSSGPENAPDCDCDSINIDKMHSYCTGCGVHFITYNATDDIPSGGGDIPVTVESTSAGDGRIYMIGLLVVYENDSMANMTYWINEGAWYTGDGQAVANFNGPYSSGVTDVTYWTLGMPYGISTNPQFNSNNIGAPDYSESGYYDFWRWDNIDTGYLATPNNQMVHPVSGGDWQRLDAAVLRLWRSPSDLPDLIVTDIDFPDVMRPNTNYTVNATIKNQGNGAANASTATLYVNDVPNGTAAVPTLNASDSATVNFTVNLPVGCHTFKVVADSAGVIGETDENNNATSENYQVGYVIVVRSNADIITEADRNVSGTYYIENRTITNCAGNGITIENTTVPFVIDNCTVQNCGGGGIYLYNLTNGMVNGSEVKNNTLSGIEVQKGSTYVELTNNTVEGNTVYGIEVGLVTLSGDEIPKFINISCNELCQNLYGIEVIGNESIVKYNNVSYNGEHGIYVFGNDNSIYNNTIENNDDYGVKLYNSSGSYVYCNTFTDNNVSGHQACDNGNTNYWNTTTEGNYWSDWTSNPGYNDNPKTYHIDCGTNKDHKPEGPAGEATIFDSSFNNQSNEFEGWTTISNLPSDVDDNLRSGDGGSGYVAIPEDTDSHSGTYSDGAVYINLDDGTYALGGTGMAYFEVTLDLSSYTDVNLTFWYHEEDCEPGEDLYIDVYNGSWYNALTIAATNNNDRSTSAVEYAEEVVDLSEYNPMTSGFKIRFSGGGGLFSDAYVIDDVTVTGTG